MPDTVQIPEYLEPVKKYLDNVSPQALQFKINPNTFPSDFGKFTNFWMHNNDLILKDFKYFCVGKSNTLITFYYEIPDWAN